MSSAVQRRPQAPPSGCGSVKRQHRNPELLRLVGQIGGDARAREDDDADRQRLEQPVVALEGSGIAVAGPVGLEDDLWNFAMIGPAGGDALGALGAAAVQQHHVGMLGADLVERRPDPRCDRCSRCRR